MKFGQDDQVSVAPNSDQTPGTVVDATAAFECARVGHEPMLRMTSIFVASWVSTCNRCGRVVEFKNPEPIHATLKEQGREAVAGTGQFPYGAANRDEASGDAWKPAGASGRVQPKNEAPPRAYSRPCSLSVVTE